MSFYIRYPSAAAASANPSVGTNGATAPTSSTEIGFIDGSGNLEGVSAANPLPVTIDGGLANPLNVNLTQVGGSAITEGQKAMAASLPVVIASDQSAVPVSAASLPLPSGASTAALQSNVQSAPGTPQTIALTIQGNSSSVAVPVSASSLPLPAGAATAANQTNGSQKEQVVDGSGTVVGPAQTISGTNYFPVVQASSATPGSAIVARSTQIAGSDGTNARTLSTDSAGVLNTNVIAQANVAPATQNITIVDSASTTTAQANGQNAITGTPTAGSAALFSVTSEESVEVQVTGTWTGTLQSEVSFDSGTTWYTRGLKQTGSSYLSNSYTANFQSGGSVAGVTNYRIRAVAAVTGTAIVKVIFSQNQASIVISNPLTLRDSVTQSIANTIKAASTASIATDTALVVALSPNSNSLAASGPVTPGAAAAKSDLAGMVYNSTVQTPTTGQQLALQSDAFGNLEVVLPDMFVTGQSAQTATVNNILTVASGSAATDVSNYRSATVQVTSTGTGGTYIFEGSNDNVNFQSLVALNINSVNGNITNSTVAATAAALIYTFPISCRYVRLRIATTITGGSIQAFSRFSQAAWTPVANQISQSSATPLNAILSTGTNAIGVVSVGPNGIINDITSAVLSVTTTSSTFIPTFGCSYLVNIACTAVNGGGTMSLAIQESSDSGTNWYTVYTFPIINNTGSFNSPVLLFNGNRVRYVQTITGTSVTRSVNRIQNCGSAEPLYRNLIDISINPTSTNSVTPSVFVENMNTYTAIINQGAGGSAVQFALDGSDDNMNWVLGLTSVYGIVGAATPVAMVYSDANFRYIRVRVVTGVAATTISSVSICGSQGSGAGVARGALTNRSGTSSTSSGQLAAANPLRNYIFIQNIDASITQYINFTSAADVSANSIALLPFATYSMEGDYVSSEIINIIAASGTPKYVAKEG